MSLLFDSDGESFGPFGSKVWDLYAKIRKLCEVEMMNFTEDELHMINLLYGDNFTYPVHKHVEELLTGVSPEETLH